MLQGNLKIELGEFNTYSIMANSRSKTPQLRESPCAVTIVIGGVKGDANC